MSSVFLNLNQVFQGNLLGSFANLLYKDISLPLAFVACCCILSSGSCGFICGKIDLFLLIRKTGNLLALERMVKSNAAAEVVYDPSASYASKSRPRASSEWRQFMVLYMSLSLNANEKALMSF